MTKFDNDNTSFARALKSVERFSEQGVAVLPETAPAELIAYIAQVTGEDAQKIARLYDMMINGARLDKYTQDTLSGQTGFAEDN